MTDDEADQIYSIVPSQGSVVGSVDVKRTIEPADGGDVTVTDESEAVWERLLNRSSAAAKLTSRYSHPLEPGYCVVTQNPNPLAAIYGIGPGAPLNAGATLGITTAIGNADLNPQGPDSFGQFFYQYGWQEQRTLDREAIPSTPALILGETEVFANGPGGVEVTSFNGMTSLPAGFSLDSPEELETIDRLSDLTIEWDTPDDDDGFFTVIGTSTAVVNGRTVSSSFACTEEADEESLTVPAWMLQMLAPSGENGSGVLRIIREAVPERVTQPGVDLLFLNYAIEDTIETTFVDVVPADDPED
jgi:hypothetical protein